MNRRAFLKLALTGSVMLATRNLPTFAAQAELPALAIPPSLMLHSRHQKQLPDLLAYLVDQGYVGITYDDFYRAVIGEIQLPEKPFLLTIDDLSMSQGIPSFKVFAKMQQTLVDYRFKGNFAIITRPDLPQDNALWAEVRRWGEAGFGLENHTSYHSNLSNPNWIEADYRADIVDAAQFIRDRTGQPVRALITPFGSGYDLTSGVIFPGVANACNEADSPLVVGIVGGRSAIQLPASQHTVHYLGRCTMGINDTNASGIWEVEHWI